MKDLLSKKCIPCSIGGEPLSHEEVDNIFKELKPGWEVIDYNHLEKSYTFKDFKEALDFTNKIGQLAEEQGHHPEIYLKWGKVKVKLWTHAIKGLHENDFILAAKIDEIV